MTTLKLRIDGQADFAEEQRVFSDIVRLSFNRFAEGMSLRQVRAWVKQRVDVRPLK